MKKIFTIGFILIAFAAEAQVTLDLKFFIEGYYRGAGVTRPDTAVVELIDTLNTCHVAASYKDIFLPNGTISCSFPTVMAGDSFYINVTHRSALSTMSPLPVVLSAVTNYDFTTASAKAYGNNMVQVGPGVWGFYNGDINHDQNFDLIDSPYIYGGVVSGTCGYYGADLNYDGNIDLIDYPILDRNINLGIFGAGCP